MANMGRRTALGYVGVALSATSILATMPSPAFAEEEDLYIASRYQNFKRGTIHSLDPKTRGLVVMFDGLGRVKMKASDMVVKTTSGYPGNASEELKVGQTDDVHW